MTRGTARRLDYRFLGGGPPRRWWAPLDDLVVLERPAVLVHGGPGHGGVLLSGVPSARRDVIGTAIRFTIVVDDPDPALLARLVAAGLDAHRRAALGARLDAAFPADLVDSAVGGNAIDEDAVCGEEFGSWLSRTLADADADADADAGPGPAAESAPQPRRSWIGSADDADAVAAFRARVAQLGAGMPGWAFTTAALTSVDGARRAVASLDRPVAVLLDEGGPSTMIDLDPGKAEAGPPAGLSPQLRHRKILVGALALAVGVIVLVVVLVRWSPSPAPPPPAPPGSSAPASTAPSTTAPPSTSLSTSTPPAGGRGPSPSG
ncbi:hypothetical protein [Geodermatophilus sp. CPCC 205761]|uniref:hypothetical protein n=1 Tax=Geodermatophilus sp. CPCC 205761 TaxID=2936597 RepID=UPI003EEC302B